MDILAKYKSSIHYVVKNVLRDRVTGLQHGLFTTANELDFAERRIYKVNVKEYFDCQCIDQNCPGKVAWLSERVCVAYINILLVCFIL